MSAIALFWTGVGLVVIAIFGLVLGLCRAAALGDEAMQRALRQERAQRAGTHLQSSPHRPPIGVDAPRALDTPPHARGAKSSRRRGHA